MRLLPSSSQASAGAMASTAMPLLISTAISGLTMDLSEPAEAAKTASGEPNSFNRRRALSPPKPRARLSANQALRGASCVMPATFCRGPLRSLCAIQQLHRQAGLHHQRVRYLVEHAEHECQPKAFIRQGEFFAITLHVLTLAVQGQYMAAFQAVALALVKGDDSILPSLRNTAVHRDDARGNVAAGCAWQIGVDGIAGRGNQAVAPMDFQFGSGDYNGADKIGRAH